MSVIFTAAAALYRQCRREYDDYLDAAYLAAEEATRGAMIEYWNDWARLTYTEFERQWVEENWA